MSMGGVIRSLRNNLEMSQDTLAFLAGVKKSEVVTIERGGKPKRGGILAMIAEVLQTDITTLQSMSEMSQISKLPPNSTEDD